jgi:hypothetical protein
MLSVWYSFLFIRGLPKYSVDFINQYLEESEARTGKFCTGFYSILLQPCTTSTQPLKIVYTSPQPVSGKHLKKNIYI